MPLFSPEQRIAIAIGVPAVALLLFLWYRRRQREEILDDEEDEDQEDSKVSTVFETKIEVKVPQNVVGTVIGRGGENIKQIQKDSGAYLRFKDDEKEKDEVPDGFDESPAPETEKTRTVIIKGEREKAKKAEMLIKKVISEQPKIFTVEHFIPQKCCGRVIGRGGSTIRHLSRASGARINIDRSDIGLNEPRKCTIKGTADQIAIAKGLLDEQVAEYQLAVARKPVNQRQTPLQPISAQQVSTATTDEAPSSPSSVQYPKTSDYVEVFVSAVENPGHFWVQMVRTGDAHNLDVLTDILTDETNTGSGNDIVDSVEVGMVCSAPFSHDDSRYRAKVTQVNKDGTVNLFYVDYGDSETVSKNRLRKLKKEHLHLPFQAIECHLANTSPKGGVWDEHATEVFKELTHYPDWKVMVVKAVKYCGDIPCLDVYDTLTEQDIWINDEMIKKGFAVEDTNYPPQPNEQKENKTEDIKDVNEIKKDSSERCREKPTTKEITLSQEQIPQDERDAGEELDLHVSGPVSPHKFSPIKNALVKRVSKDYIDSTQKQEGSKASIDVISEEMTSDRPKDSRVLVEETQIQLAECSPEVESSPEIIGMYESESNVFPSSDMNEMLGDESKALQSQPEVKEIVQPERDILSSYSPKKNASHVLKPEVQEMIEIEVSQAFETELTPSRHIVTQSTVSDSDKSVTDGSNPEVDVVDSGIGLDVKIDEGVKHIETTLNVTVGSSPQPSVITVDSKANNDAIDDDDDDDDDDDLETFTTTFQKQVQAKKTFVSSVTVTSNKQANVTLVPSSEKKEYVTDVSRQPTKRPYAQAVRTSRSFSNEGLDSWQKSSPAGEGETSQDSRNHGNVFTVKNLEIQAKPDEKGTFVINSEVENGSFRSISTAVQETSQTSFDLRTTNKRVTNEGKVERENSGKIERRSPDNIESDSESYVSALDEPASDTDTASNYETATGGPTSGSSEYITADNGTDTDTLRPVPGGEWGTPVNSDSDDDDDEYDTDDEDESDDGDKTPKRKASEGNDAEEGTPTSNGSMKMAAKYLSDLDLGYRGDAEDTTESREDLR